MGGPNMYTLERPPHPSHYRIAKQLERGRPSMPQLMRGVSSGPASDDRNTVMPNGVQKKRPKTVGIDTSTHHSKSTVLNGSLGTMKTMMTTITNEEGYLRTFKPDNNPDRPESGRGRSRAGARRVSIFDDVDEPEKLHFFDAVFVPCFTNICGTLLYLRMGYVAGQAGILAGVGIVLFSSLVVSITALSAAAICSNGKQLGSGVYYVVSRSLGPQFGGVIAVIFSLANVGMAALYIVGISEFISDLMADAGYSYLTINREDDIRLFSIVICSVLTMIAFAGPKFSRLTTMVFFATYITSYMNWLVGTMLPVSDENQLKGVTGYNWITVRQNIYPDFRNGESIVGVFAVFFPGFTGMLAGTMFLSQLRNPGQDMAIGLFTGITTTTVMYVVAVIACGATMLRDADGNTPPTIDNSTGVWAAPGCEETNSCRYGLDHYYQVAELTSAWRPLIIVGMFGMTISSTMTNLDQGPQNFQAACKDNVFPYMKILAKEYGLNKEPRRAYLFCAFITLALTLIGDLNMLNEIVTNLFMASYVLVNYACFDASFVRSPGWRPEFFYYSQWASLFGAGLCVVIMFVVSVHSSMIISAVFGACLAYFHYSHPEVNWGDSNQAHIYRNALSNCHQLTASEEHVKNYRPQVLLLCGNPAARRALLDFGHAITKGASLLIAGHVVTSGAVELVKSAASDAADSHDATNACSAHPTLKALEEEMERWFRENRYRAFYDCVADTSLRRGAASLEQLCGLGKLRPNVILLGFKHDWWVSPQSEWHLVHDYVGIIRDTFEKEFGIGILRSEGGLDLSEEFILRGVRDVNALGRRGTTWRTVAAPSVGEVPATSLGAESALRKSLRLSSAYLHRVGSWVHVQPQVASQRRSSKFFSDRHWFNVAPPREEAGDDAASNSSTLQEMRAAQLEKTIYCKSRRAQERVLRRSRSEPSGMSDRIVEELAKERTAIESLTRRREARIDVWWLFDDGGLTLLIPHLLRLPRSYLEDAELRVLTITGKSYSTSDIDEKQMIALLSKFRIAFKAVKVIRVLKQRLHPDILGEFDRMVKPWMRSSELNETWSEPEPDANGSKLPNAFFITDEELRTQRNRTYRQLLTRQLLIQHSTDAALIVITLPVPRSGVSTCMYMVWLDLLTRDLPPSLLVRGNQTSVLTFYA